MNCWTPSMHQNHEKLVQVDTVGPHNSCFHMLWINLLLKDMNCWNYIHQWRTHIKQQALGLSLEPMNIQIYFLYYKKYVPPKSQSNYLLAQNVHPTSRDAESACVSTCSIFMSKAYNFYCHQDLAIIFFSGVTPYLCYKIMEILSLRDRKQRAKRPGQRFGP